MIYLCLKFIIKRWTLPSEKFNYKREISVEEDTCFTSLFKILSAAREKYEVCKDIFGFLKTLIRVPIFMNDTSKNKALALNGSLIEVLFEILSSYLINDA